MTKKVKTTKKESKASLSALEKIAAQQAAVRAAGEAQAAAAIKAAKKAAAKNHPAKKTQELQEDGSIKILDLKKWKEENNYRSC